MNSAEDRDPRANPGEGDDASKDLGTPAPRPGDGAGPDPPVGPNNQAALPCQNTSACCASDATPVTTPEPDHDTPKPRLANAEFEHCHATSDDALFPVFSPNEEVKGRSNSLQVSATHHALLEDELKDTKTPHPGLMAVSMSISSCAGEAFGSAGDALDHRLPTFREPLCVQRLRGLGSAEAGKRLSSSTNFNGKSLVTRVSMDLFNKDPVKGVVLLVVGRVVEPSCKCVAEFCKNCSFLSRAKIGELLSKASSKFHLDVLQCFTELFDFRDMYPDQALRVFLSFFMMAGESQVVFRILSAFSERYVECNRDGAVMSELGLQGAGDVMTLAYSIIMLNVDQHKPLLPLRMKPREFIQNLRCSEDCGTVSDEYLLYLFESVRAKELALLPDYRNQLVKLRELYSLGRIMDTGFRQFVGIHVVRELEFGARQRRPEKEREREVLLFNDCAFVLKKNSETLAGAAQHRRRNIASGIGIPGSGQGAKNLVAVYDFLDNSFCVGGPDKEENTFCFLDRSSGKFGPRFRASSDRDFGRLCDQVKSCMDEMLLLDQLERGVRHSQFERVLKCISDQDKVDEEIDRLRAEFFCADLLLDTPEATAGERSGV